LFTDYLLLRKQSFAFQCRFPEILPEVYRCQVSAFTAPTLCRQLSQ
jgi:hypothetical protein